MPDDEKAMSVDCPALRFGKCFPIITCPDVTVDGPCTICGKPFDEHTHIFHGEDLCPGGEGVYTCKDCPHA